MNSNVSTKQQTEVTVAPIGFFKDEKNLARIRKGVFFLIGVIIPLLGVVQ